MAQLTSRTTYVRVPQIRLILSDYKKAEKNPRIKSLMLPSMSRNMDESDQRSHPNPFQTLKTDSKLMFLRRAIDGYEQTQLYFRQNSDHQRRLKQLMEYNRIKLIELDLARQRILQSNEMADARMNVSVGSPQISKPPDKPQGVKPRVSAKNALPMQRPWQPTETTTRNKVPEKYMASLTTHAAGIEPKGTHDNLSQKNEGRMVGERKSSARVVDNNNYIRGTTDKNHDLHLKLRTSTHTSPLQRPQQPTATGPSRFGILEQHMTSSRQTDSFKPKDTQMSNKNEGSTMDSQESLTGGGDSTHHSTTDEESGTEQVSKIMKKDMSRWRYSFNFKDADVLFERGNFAYNHAGNRVYRGYIKTLQDEYIRCPKNDKHSIATKVLHFIKNTCGGRFLACDTEVSGEWEELSDDAARRKIGQSLREKNKRYMPPPRSRKNGKRTSV